MTLKDIFKSFTLLPILIAGGLAATIPRTSKCKAVPGSDDWPSLETWTAFNQSIQGRLIKPTPPGAVCHSDHPAYNFDQCQVVQTAWSGEPLHSNDPVSVMWNNWNNDTCLPDPRLSCNEAGYAIYVVNATTPEHVKAGIDFARQHNIRLIVKNSGHDYIGRSSAPNSLSIWVHHMKSFKAHPSSFQPTGCDFSIPDSYVITAGAGTQMLEAYRATALFNRTLVGGNGRTVALGGFITGGGHSILAAHYGMAADQVLQLELVTPQGEILIANECQNQDLFWAMRGGGGSTFGVLTSVTLQTVPSPQVSSLGFLIATPSTNPQAFDAVTYFLTQLPVLEAAGVTGYPIVFQNSPSSTPGDPTLYTGIVGKLIMLNTSSTQTVLSHINPIASYISSTFSGSSINSFLYLPEVKTYSSFGAWYEENYDPSPVGHSNVMGSRLLTASSLTRNITATKLAFQKFSSGGQATAYIVSGRGVWNAKPRGGSTAVNPAWRKGVVVHATASVFFNSGDIGAKEEASRLTKGYSEALRDLTRPELDAAYLNEADKYEKDWQKTFWGEDNYERLLSIKKSVDPDNVFWCMPCVGGEGWKEVEGGKLCRV
ncbi:Tetrahydrocannabinolic acid synthase [Podospora fimiseda]|uniref:Tetrahydrocannabinolic acid synthase n=1 Tax=Podospora fimiseda TaxID=252190 RepID=A0AAN7BI03_9PEZI|nr:Tetrahydrocannabinolic acid synthase [Podospora fimiseda]